MNTGCQESKTDSAATGSFGDSKAVFVSIFNQCSALGVNPTSQLSAQDAANAKAAMGLTSSPSNGPTTQPSSAPPTNVPSSAPPINAAGLVASVVLVPRPWPWPFETPFETNRFGALARRDCGCAGHTSSRYSLRAYLFSARVEPLAYVCPERLAHHPA